MINSNQFQDYEKYFLLVQNMSKYKNVPEKRDRDERQTIE